MIFIFNYTPINYVKIFTLLVWEYNDYFVFASLMLLTLLSLRNQTFNKFKIYCRLYCGFVRVSRTKIFACKIVLSGFIIAIHLRRIGIPVRTFGGHNIRVSWTIENNTVPTFVITSLFIRSTSLPARPKKKVRSDYFIW